jgi:threonine dehydratase
MSTPPTLGDVQVAAATIAAGVTRTPLVRAEALDEIAGAPVWLKAELLQHTGSFKLRGALNRMQALSAAERAAGVVTVSAGNHAAAVARAGALTGTDVLVLMPRAASATKVAATRGYGATVDLASADATEAFARMQAVMAETGRIVIHPFDDPAVIAGAGTVGLEIADDLPDVDLVVCPVGGGGLLSGIATALAGLAPDARLVAVQPQATGTLVASLEAGAPTRIAPQPTIADALTPPAVGGLPLAILRDRLAGVVVLDEDQLAAGFRLAYARGRLAPEPGGSAAIGALAAGLVDTAGARNVVCVVSGGNVDPALAAALLAA